MPREYRLVSTEPVDLDAVVAAARAVDPSLQPRLLFDGWAVQLVDDRDVAVLTVEASRRLDDLQQAEQLIGPLPTAGPVWWTEASAPWGEYGEPGSRLIRVVGESIGARVLAEEGQ